MAIEELKINCKA